MNSPPPLSSSTDDRIAQLYAPSAYSEPNRAIGSSAAGANLVMYNANQVALATFFGTPLAGAIVLAINESRFGRKSAAITTVILGVLAAAALFGIVFALPDHFPSAPLGFATTFGMRAIANRRQKFVADHIAAGGKPGSNWVAFGIGVGSLVTILVPIFAIAFAMALVTPEQ